MKWGGVLSAKKNVWLLTGDPGSGKTTAVLKVVSIIKSKGFSVGGVVSREKTQKGVRVGFTLEDLSSGFTDTLASIDQPLGPRMGKYRVNLRGLSDLAAQALLHAIDSSDLIVCDEIGPMELFSPEFKRAVKQAVFSGKPLIGVIHKRLIDPLVDEIRGSTLVEIIEVSNQDLDKLAITLADRIISEIK